MFHTPKNFIIRFPLLLRGCFKLLCFSLSLVFFRDTVSYKYCIQSHYIFAVYISICALPSLYPPCFSFFKHTFFSLYFFCQPSFALTSPDFFSIQILIIPFSPLKPSHHYSSLSLLFLSFHHCWEVPFSAAAVTPLPLILFLFCFFSFHFQKCKN